MIKLAIGLPAYRAVVTSRQVPMWIMLGKQLVSWGDRIELVGVFDADTCGVERARNYLLATAMSSGVDWLLMIDSDTWVEMLGMESMGMQLLRMVASGKARGAAVIGAPVMRRTGVNESTPAVYQRIGTMMDVGYKPMRHDELPSHGIAEVDAIGAACMAIDLRKIGDAVFQFTDERSEDLEFCRQVKSNGGVIMVDTRVQTGHWNSPAALNYPRGT